MARITESQLRSIVEQELKKILNEEEVVTFTVKQNVKSHYGVGIVETVGTYDSFEKAVEVAKQGTKQGNRYIVSSEGKQFFPKYDSEGKQFFPK